MIATPVSVHCINLPVMFVLFKKVAGASLTDVRVGILCKHIGVAVIFFFSRHETIKGGDMNFSN